MKIYLKVKYEEREIVKSLGASWDYVGKAWFIDSRNTNMAKFSRFMHIPEHLSRPHIPTAYEKENASKIRNLPKSEKRKINKRQNAINNNESSNVRRASFK